MMKIIKNNKIILLEIIVFLILYIILWLFDELFNCLWLLLFIPVFLLFIAIGSLFIYSIVQLFANSNKYKWLTFFINILLILIFIIFNPLTMRENYNFNKVKNERYKIVNKIVKEKINNNYSIINNKDYKRISKTGNVVIPKNDEKGVIILFCESEGIPDDSVYLVYSTLSKNEIKKIEKNIENIEDITKNWYRVYFK